MNSFLEFVGPIYIINLKQREDRWGECLKELDRLGVAPDRVCRFEAIQSGVHGSVGCALSHASALIKFITESDAPRCLILEDDFNFIGDFTSALEGARAFEQSVHDWDVLLLSGNEILALDAGSPHYVKVISSQTTSAYVIQRSAIPRLVQKLVFGADKLKSILSVLPVEHWMKIIPIYSADMIWKDLQKEGRWYMLNPKPVIQRPSYSDIWLREANYGV